MKQAKNEVIALIDNDNILPQTDWLRKMVEPFQDSEIDTSGPLYYKPRSLPKNEIILNQMLNLDTSILFSH